MVFPSHSSYSFCISVVSFSSGNPASAVVVHTFWSGACCWWVRRRRVSSGLRMMSPSCGCRGSVVLRRRPCLMFGAGVWEGGAGMMCAWCISSSSAS